MLTTDTTAVDTVTDTVSDTAVTTVDTMDTPMLDTDTVTLARGPLMPSPRLMPLLMLTTDTTAVDTDTVMAVTMVDTTDTPDTDTVMAVSDTTVRLSKSQLAIVTTPLELFQLNTSPPPHRNIHPVSKKLLDQETFCFDFFVKKGVVQNNIWSELFRYDIQ